MTSVDDNVGEFELLNVLGRCGPIDNSRSVVKEVKFPVGVPEKKFGLFFDRDSWTQDDFFVPEGTTRIFVTPRVKEFLESGFPNVFKIRDTSTVQNYGIE